MGKYRAEANKVPVVGESEQIVERTLLAKGIAVTVYDFERSECSSINPSACLVGGGLPHRQEASHCARLLRSSLAVAETVTITMQRSTPQCTGSRFSPMSSPLRGLGNDFERAFHLWLWATTKFVACMPGVFLVGASNRAALDAAEGGKQ